MLIPALGLENGARIKFKGILWEFVAKTNTFPLKMSFDEIFSVLGFEIDHSFLTYKKETADYGFIVKKISLKAKSVIFDRP